MAKSFFKFYRSGEISPDLVTLTSTIFFSSLSSIFLFCFLSFLFHIPFPSIFIAFFLSPFLSSSFLFSLFTFSYHLFHSSFYILSELCMPTVFTASRYFRFSLKNYPINGFFPYTISEERLEHLTRNK